MRKRMFGFCCLFMALVTLVLTVCPAMAVDKTMKGHFGDDLIWLFTPGNSTLTVKGKGDMDPRLSDADDSCGASSPWKARKIDDKIRTVVIEEGVTSVGCAMFMHCSALEEVRLPQSLTHIDSMAFAYTAVKEIVIPENVIFIGSGAFSHCRDLRKVHLERSSTMEIELDAFYDTALRYGDHSGENGADLRFDPTAEKTTNPFSSVRFA